MRRRRTQHQNGFTLIELVITVTVLSILSLGVVPLIKNSIKRQKETQLRDALREMRDAIDQFKRDTEGVTYNGISAVPTPNYVPPRSKIYISDGKIFTVDNQERYPPDLETLVKGVEVKPRIPPGTQTQGGQGLGGTGGVLANQEGEVSGKTKIYLRKIPIDPITGEAEWELRSTYDAADATSWGRENVFDVRSKSTDTALNGEKYSDW